MTNVDCRWQGTEKAAAGTVIFLPGWGCNLHFYHPFLDLIAQKKKVVGFQFRGRGESTSPDPAAHSFALHASDVYEVVKAAGVTEEATLIGHAGGCGSGFAFIKDHPELVKQFILVDGLLHGAMPPDQPPMDELMGGIDKVVNGGQSFYDFVKKEYGVFFGETCPEALKEWTYAKIVDVGPAAV